MTKLSIVNNSIGGKQREQRGSLTFSPNQIWMILPNNNTKKLPQFLSFSFIQCAYSNSLIQSSKYIKVKSSQSKAYTKKIVLPFSIAKKYNNSLQSFVQNIVFIKSLL